MSRSYESFVSDVAGEICMESLAERLNLEDLDIEAAIENAICYDQIADSVENNVDFQCMVDEWCQNNIDPASEIDEKLENMVAREVKIRVDKTRETLIPMILAMVKQNMPKPWWHRLKFWRKRT
jgi:anti-sigma-K factor RskA